MVLPSRRGLLSAATVTATGASTVMGLMRQRSAPLPEGAPFVDALKAGAKGDGSTDDADALNAAIAGLADLGGGVLWMPRGTYLLGSPMVLRSGVSVVSGAAGHGYTASGTAAAVVLQAAADLTSSVVDSDEDVVGAHLSGVEVRGNGRCAGIRLRKASWCSVTRSSVDRCGGPGVLVEAGMASVLEDLLLTNCVLERRQDAVVGVLDVDGTDHYVSRCEANASLTKKTSDDKRVAAIVLRGANHFASDSVGEYSDVGVVVLASTCRFSNVRADTNRGDGFVVRGSANAFAACTAAGNSQDSAGTDDGWVAEGQGNTFAACNVVTPPGTSIRHGFRDTVNTADAAQRNTYAACTVDTSSNSPWQTEGFLGSSPAVPPNAIRPRPGTTEVDVAQATLIVLFDYEAPTAITAFTNGVNGQAIQVLGHPSVTITASATIRTASGLPVLMATDRVVSFTHYDGAWYQTG